MSRMVFSSMVAAALISVGFPSPQARAQFVNRQAARWFGGAAVAGAGINYGLGYGYSPYGYGPAYGYGGTTAAESYQRGMADVIRAQGEANESAARAARDYEAARSQYIENQSQWLEEYNRRKRIGKAEQQAEFAERREAVDRYRSLRDARSASQPAAAQLDPDTGEIHWPDVLQSDEYQAGRRQLDELFQIREESGNSSALAEEIRQTIRQMQSKLQTHLRDYSVDDFLTADRFLKSLAAAGSSAG